VDTGAGLSEHTLSALDRSTDYVFVAGMDVPSIRGLRKELDVLKSLGMVAPHQHLVLNSADPRDGLSLRDVEAALGQKADVVVPFRREVRLSTNRGVPLLQGGKRDPATRELRKLLQRFPAAAGKAGMTPGPTPASPARATTGAAGPTAAPRPTKAAGPAKAPAQDHQPPQPAQGQTQASKRSFLAKRFSTARHRKGTP
jgi:hypothetical protein